METTAGRGLSLRVRRVEGAPLVAARAWLRGGSCQEQVPGQAYVVGQLLTEGTGSRSWEQIHAEAENRGILLQSFGTHEMLGVAIDALAGDWELTLGWLAELLLDPTFPADRFEWVRKRTAAELESLLDRPEVRTGKAFLEQLYGPHPYGRPLRGDPASLGRLTVEGCRNFHRRTLDWGAIVVVTGEIDEAAVEHRLGELLGSFEGMAQVLPELAPPQESAVEHQQISAGESDQAHLFAGHLTIERRHPDIPALEVVAAVLGAGPGLAGRLPERIREKEGLAYSTDVQTTAGSGLDPGRLAIYVGTSPRTAAAAERALREELERLLEEGISEREFEEARSYLIGAEPFRRETARQWADILAEATFYELPIDQPHWVIEQLQALSREEVETVARRHLRPAELKVTLGLPER